MILNVDFCRIMKSGQRHQVQASASDSESCLAMRTLSWHPLCFTQLDVKHQRIEVIQDTLCGGLNPFLASSYLCPAPAWWEVPWNEVGGLVCIISILVFVKK